jgi:hypothetical protein
MAESKMVDADGHIREVESDVFDYLPAQYKRRREAVLYFPLLPHHGWHATTVCFGRRIFPTRESWIWLRR